jgi:hypothetical protein
VGGNGVTETIETESARFTVVGDCELSDAAISVLATILLELPDESTFTVTPDALKCCEPAGVEAPSRL